VSPTITVTTIREIFFITEDSGKDVKGWCDHLLQEALGNLYPFQTIPYFLGWIPYPHDSNSFQPQYLNSKQQNRGRGMEKRSKAYIQVLVLLDLISYTNISLART
jgi:hypothetical protein